MICVAGEFRVIGPDYVDTVVFVLEKKSKARLIAFLNHENRGSG